MIGQIPSAVFQAVGVSWPLELGSWFRLSICGFISSYDVTQLFFHTSFLGTEDM